ncbi:hypothetical protein Tco_1282669 [Tanacetum coccineum]
METLNIQDTDVLSIRARKHLHRAFKNFDDFESFRALIDDKYGRKGSAKMKSVRSGESGVENLLPHFSDENESKAPERGKLLCGKEVHKEED